MMEEQDLKNKEVIKITDYFICSRCKGQCCQSLPGIYHPADIERMYEDKISIELLVKVFNTEQVAVDWWEGDPRYDIMDERNGLEDALSIAYYLRPRGINKRNELKDPAYRNNPCIHWDRETGCQLPEFNRPYGCRTLIPNPDEFPYGCDYKKENDGSKQAMSVAWIPYQKMIRRAIKIYQEK